MVDILRVENVVKMHNLNICKLLQILSKITYPHRMSPLWSFRGKMPKSPKVYGHFLQRLRSHV